MPEPTENEPRRPPPVKLPSSGIRLFQLFGITVYLHWAWFLILLLAVQRGGDEYSSVLWGVAEYVALFGIVLLHEFGHALACKSVGGRAERIMLWPLGGVAFVSPPQRPGAVLWSIAAGPLVNVLLVPVTFAAYLLLRDAVTLDLRQFLWMLAVINAVLLIFNMLPIYPLDGGQILRSLLWFFIGAARSLLVATVIGLIGAAAFLVFALYLRDFILVLIALFGASQSWQGFTAARQIMAFERLPRHWHVRCPSCGQHPPAGEYWTCEACGHRLDAFVDTHACPGCGQPSGATPCIQCGRAAPPEAWLVNPAATVPTAAPAAGPYSPPRVPPAPPWGR